MDGKAARLFCKSGCAGREGAFCASQAQQNVGAEHAVLRGDGERAVVALDRCGDGGQTDAVILFMRGGQAVWGEGDFADIAVFHGQAEHRAADHAGNHPNLPRLDGQGADGAQRVFQQVAQHHAQIDLIERLTTQIFDCVKEHPEKLKQIRQFLNYYLPTTIKLMEQYVKLQNQSVKTENITEGMQKIEDLLDKVIVAFQRQLDALFESDVVDITADIRVMEQMMASEGLTEKKDFA